MNVTPGDLIYYDKCGGPIQGVFPFAEKEAWGVGILISEVMTYDYQGVDEKGNKLDFALDYLEPIVI